MFSRARAFTVPVALAILLAVPAPRTAASDIAVFGKEESYTVFPGEARLPAEPGKLAFVEAYRADAMRRAPFGLVAPLVNPPEWGKTISPQTHGMLLYRNSFAGGFNCHLVLQNLAPDHDYILTLNGNPALAGNDLLPEPVPGNPKERYVDFLIVRSDAKGAYQSGLGISLRPGDYDVRFYVKDASDFKIVLYRDYFKFTVK